MFSNIGWLEIFAIFIIGLIVVGPERLPKLIEDCRAAIYAARKAINNAKKELDGEFSGVTSEFEEFRKPLSTIATYSRMGPKAAFTKALLDGDDSFLDDFDPKKIMEDTTAGQAHRAGGKAPTQQVERPENTEMPQTQQPSGAEPQQAPRGEFSWDDIT